MAANTSSLNLPTFLFIGLCYLPMSIAEQLETDKVSTNKSNIVNMAFVDHKLPFSSSQNSGLEIDIARAALAATNLVLKVHFFDNDKLRLALKNHRVDAIAPAFKTDEHFYETDTFVSYYNYAITKKKKQITLNSIQDIADYHSAAWKSAHSHLGATYNKIFAPLLANEAPNYLEISNQVNQCRMFWLDRIDIIIIDKSIFDWCKLQLSDLDTSAAIEIHSLFANPNNYPALFSSKELRDKFNIGLRALHKSGQYQRIIERHFMPELINQ